MLEDVGISRRGRKYSWKKVMYGRREMQEAEAL